MSQQIAPLPSCRVQPCATTKTRHGNNDHRGQAYPVYGDSVDGGPPYILKRHYGQPTITIAKEKVVYSSPIARSVPRKRDFSIQETHLFVQTDTLFRNSPKCVLRSLDRFSNYFLGVKGRQKPGLKLRRSQVNSFR